MNLDVAEEQPTEADRRFFHLVEINTPLLTIQRITGIKSPTVLQRRIRETGLNYTPTAGGKGHYVSSFNEKTLADTFRFRINMANWLHAYADGWDSALTTEQLVYATGLGSRALKRLRERPHDHDFTLTQLSRFAALLGMSFSDLVMDCTSRSGLSLPQIDATKAIHPSKIEIA